MYGEVLYWSTGDAYVGVTTRFLGGIRVVKRAPIEARCNCRLRVRSDESTNLFKLQFPFANIPQNYTTIETLNDPRQVVPKRDGHGVSK